MKKCKWLLWLGCLLALALLLTAAFDQRLAVRYYTVTSDKVDYPVRLAVLTDFHEYGPEDIELLQATELEGIHAFLIVGDWFADGGSYTYAASVLRTLAAHSPCYYVTGNHEYWTGEVDRLLGIVEDCGVTVLNMESDLLTIGVGGMTLRICGIPDPYAAVYSGAPDTAAQLERAAAQVQPGEFAILLAHRPELIEQYAQYPFDLVVSGHAHGGQVRVPGLINGLYAPNQGWFPKYAGGLYQVEDTALIVSRGLSTQAQWYVPRIFNRPEMVVVELSPH